MNVDGRRSGTNDLDWLRDSGVQIDRKGRIVVSFSSPDYEAEFDANDDEPPITELMRRDVNTRTGGSRGRRRRPPPKSTQGTKRAAPADDPPRTSRIGRPPIGAEVRIYVQTSIAKRTREILAERGLTLAQVFDDYARELAHVP